jgi:hypothetical protein
LELKLNGGKASHPLYALSKFLIHRIQEVASAGLNEDKCSWRVEEKNEMPLLCNSRKFGNTIISDNMESRKYIEESG